jgi:hypothetical protein
VRTRLHLRIGSGRVRAEVLRWGKPVWAGEASFADPGELGYAIASLAAESAIPTRNLGLRVTLDRSVVQVRTLADLPSVKRADLRALVANQAHRFFRKNGKRLVTDAAWARRTRGLPPAAIAAAVEEPWLDAIAEGATAAGLQLQTIAPDLGLPAARLELVTLSQRARREQTGRLTLKRIGAATGLLWFIAATLVIGRVHRETHQIERELAALEQSAAAVVKLRREIGEAVAMIDALDQADQQRSAILGRLAAIVASLPDSAYLSSVTIDRQGVGTLTGAAPQAARVVAALDRDGAVAGPRLAGPAVRDANNGGPLRERFTITFGSPGVR